MRKIMNPNQVFKIKPEIVAVIRASNQIQSPRDRGEAAIGIARRMEVIKVEKSHKVIHEEES